MIVVVVLVKVILEHLPDSFIGECARQIAAAEVSLLLQLQQAFAAPG